jgi:CyaY protein
MTATRETSEFHQRADRLLEAIDGALGASPAAAAAGIDCEINQGILTIEFADGSKAIVNRQAPLAEIWLAARHGGFHFRFADGRWRDTRDGVDFETRLNDTLQRQSGRVIDITF